jgi:hypothetical protein
MGDSDNDKAPSATLETYGGTYTLTNCTGDTITDVSLTLATGAGKYPLVEKSLAPGQSSGPVKFESQSGSRDFWSISFTRGGQGYSKQNKQCNFETDDAGQNVAFTVARKNYSIVMPESSPCIQNGY